MTSEEMLAVPASALYEVVLVTPGDVCRDRSSMVWRVIIMSA